MENREFKIFRIDVKYYRLEMKVVVAVCLELKIINPPPKRGFETKIDASNRYTRLFTYNIIHVTANIEK